MKTPRRPLVFQKAFTLMEMTIVLLVLLALTRAGFMVFSRIGDWRAGRDAAETLRNVHIGQRMFLADNPTVLVTNITTALVIPYLPNNALAMPTVRALTGANLNILVNQTPPIIDSGNGTFYDPSSSRTDSLWDVGE
jgi:type II secretory pathway pseudopilin PulG